VKAIPLGVFPQDNDANTSKESTSITISSLRRQVVFQSSRVPRRKARTCGREHPTSTMV